MDDFQNIWGKSKYGIQVKGSTDTLVAWDPSHFHGTSLQDYLPDSEIIPEYHQVGLLCITPNWIPGLWKKYAEQQVTLEEVREEVIKGKDDEDEDGN